jgi:hypothetical protein
MAIRNAGDYPIDPTSTSGVELAAIENRLAAALDSNNANATRPGYITAGGTWVQQTAGTLDLMMFDGTNDTLIASMNTTTGDITLGGNGIVSNPPAGTNQEITAADPADIPLTLTGAAGQTADLLKAGDFSVNKDGDILGAGTDLKLQATADAALADAKSVVSRERGDARYLQLSGGAVTGTLAVNGYLSAKAGITALPLLRSTAIGRTAAAPSVNGQFRIYTVANQTAIAIMADTGQTTPVQTWCNPVGTVLSRIEPTGAFVPPSDSDLKDNQQEITDALGAVKKITGKTFDWKEDSKPDAGLIAQEVHAALGDNYAEMPKYDADGNKTEVGHVSYNAITGLLVNAVKEQQSIIESLTARIEALEAKS